MTPEAQLTRPPRPLRVEPFCTECGHPAVWKPAPAVIPHVDPADDADHPVALDWRARAAVSA